MELLRQSIEMQRGMSAQIEALKAQITSRRPEQKGLNPTGSFLRYQETPPLESVTQNNSQMHRLRTLILSTTKRSQIRQMEPKVRWKR